MIATTNWHSKIKKYGYKLKEWFYGQSYMDKVVMGACLAIEIVSHDLPSVINWQLTSLACKVSHCN